MVAIGAIIQNEEDMAKSFKQIYISSAELKEYIDLIAERVRQNSNELVRHAAELEPPFPLQMIIEGQENNQFNLSGLTLACYSAVLYLHTHMKNVSEREWKICIEEYTGLRLSDPGGSTKEHRWKGIETPIFRQDILEVSEQIGNWLNNQNIKPSYLVRGDNVNHRVVVHLALICLGRKLKAEKEAAESKLSDHN